MKILSMKLFKVPNLILLLTIFIFSCSTNESSDQNNSNDSPVTDIQNEQPPEAFSLSKSQKVLLKEQLFYFLRERIVNIDHNTFVKHESLELDGLDFEYTAVIADRDALVPIAMKNRKSIVKLVAYYQSFPNEQLGDSIKIKGSIEIQESASASLEGQLTYLKVNVSGKYSNSYSEYNNYSQEMERINSQDNINQELIVKLNEPRIYGKDKLYMKARISLLKEEDLKGMSSDELAYLRNEIFARHGHNFKTDKMSEYFRQQNWYKPYFDDATAFLNETEKKNAQFIKSLES